MSNEWITLSGPYAGDVSASTIEVRESEDGLYFREVMSEGDAGAGTLIHEDEARHLASIIDDAFGDDGEDGDDDDNDDRPLTDETFTATLSVETMGVDEAREELESVADAAREAREEIDELQSRAIVKEVDTTITVGSVSDDDDYDEDTDVTLVDCGGCTKTVTLGELDVRRNVSGGHDYVGPGFFFNEMRIDGENVDPEQFVEDDLDDTSSSVGSESRDSLTNDD